MINVNKIKPITSKYGYEFVHIDASFHYGDQYKFSKTYKHLKLNIYLRFNNLDKVSKHFYLIELKNTILKEKDLENVIKAKSIIDDDIDKIIKELNKWNITDVENAVRLWSKMNSLIEKFV